MKPAIKPCPFCGSKNVELQDDTSSPPEIAFVWCLVKRCGIIGPCRTTVRAAVAAWNRAWERTGGKP